MNVRPFGEADFEAVVALLREDEEHTLQRSSQIGASDLREWTSRSNLAESSCAYARASPYRTLQFSVLGWIISRSSRED